MSGYFAFTGPDNLQADRAWASRCPSRAFVVAGNFFQTLGVKPALGRLFRRGRVRAEHAQPVVLLSHPFWKRQFDGDPQHCRASTIDLSGKPVTVIGRAAGDIRFWRGVFAGREGRYVRAVTLWTISADDGNDPGADRAAETRSDAGRRRRRTPMTGLPDTLCSRQQASRIRAEGYTAELTGLKDYVSGKLRRSLIVLWCAVGTDSADCVREPIEPAAGAGGGAEQGVRDAQRSGRGRGAAGAASC